ncbi:porin PorA family protein [Corynebacterium sp.]|uniref:porin PorA family protein n=1 Tax=Corynebacterium sp. TaxID=1720 RepID=UPI0026DBECA0|nr:porin PorA family protein [Corynebacterium sp.]MDO4609950.1 porin PorA family protein [Corynebacterium sp.]
MLPRSRVAAILLTGLGTALLAAGLLLPRSISSEPALPASLPHTTLVMLDDAGVSTRILPDGTREEVDSPLRRQFHAEFIPPADDGMQSMRVGSSLTRGDGELVSALVWTFTVDRLTGLPTGPAQLSTQPVDVDQQIDMGGSWVKFPAGAEERTYPVFDERMRGPVDAGFVGDEDRNGTRILHYRQEIPDANLAQRYDAIDSTYDVEGKRGFLHYSGTRDWWVEPRSGLVVDLAEDTETWWETADGERLATQERFAGTMPREVTDAQLAQAADIADTPATRPWGIALVVIGAIVAVAGAAGVLRPGRRGDRDGE